MLNDDLLTSISSATTVLLDGSDMERLAILFQFPQLLEHCPEDTLQIMVPEICRDVIRWKEEVQMAAAEALYFVVNKNIPPPVAKRILIASLRLLDTSESTDVFDAWGEILAMIIPQIDRSDIVSLVIPALKNRSSEGGVKSRRLTARVIGSISKPLKSRELENLFLKQAVELCSDSDSSVRAMIAQSLSSLGSKLSISFSERYLWPALKNLMDDKSARVRAAAMRAIAYSAEVHKEHHSSSNHYRSFLLPMFLQWCQNGIQIAAEDLRNVDDDTYLMLEIFSEVYGYFLSAVKSLFETEDTWNLVFNVYRQMVSCNGPTVRHWCAFNLPAVALACGDSRPRQIRGVLKLLSTDNDVETRATLAAGIHETARILSNGPLGRELLIAVSELIVDDCSEVRKNSLSHFAELLMLLGRIKSTKQKRSQEKSDEHFFTPLFTSLKVMPQDTWRTQETLAKHLEESAYLIPPELLCEYVAPFLFQMARESSYCVRKASICALISTVRYIPDVRKRDHILKHLRAEWARGKVFWTRISYIDGCNFATGIMSRRLFSRLFASDLLELSRDPVPNVRMRLARLMPELFAVCGSKKSFTTAMEALLTDNDADVKEEALNSKRKIDTAPPPSKHAQAEDLEKEALERKFFVQRRPRKESDKDKKRLDESSKASSSQKTSRRVSSFTSNSESVSGAVKTIVVHSVLGTKNVELPRSNSGLAYVEGQVLVGNTKINSITEDGLDSEKPDDAVSIDRKKNSSLRAHNIRKKKRAMCGCFGVM